MPQWISYKTAAVMLGCSENHISAMARAADYQGKHIDEIPVNLRRYLAYGFPAPVHLGQRLRRINADELQKWMMMRTRNDNQGWRWKR